MKTYIVAIFLVTLFVTLFIGMRIYNMFSKEDLNEQGELRGFCGWSTYGKCLTDADCVRGGCSGQVCQSRYEKPVITTCEWKKCYDPSTYGVVCACIDGKCRWTPVKG